MTGPQPAPLPKMSREEKWYRRDESKVSEEIAQKEGDHLLKQGDLIGSEVAFRIAARIRLRRDEQLEAF